jgi:hypothetical protein
MPHFAPSESERPLTGISRIFNRLIVPFLFSHIGKGERDRCLLVSYDAILPLESRWLFAMGDA